MPDNSAPGRNALPKRIEAIARRLLPAKHRAGFLGFLRRYFDSGMPQRAIQRPPEELFAVARQHWQLLQQRRHGQSLVRVFNPTAENDDWHSASTVVQTVTEDMPFLVDSINMAVRAVGGTIEWILHPVMTVKRDARGRLRSVGAATGGKSLESLVHVEFCPRLDKAGCESLAGRIEFLLADLRLVVNDYPAMIERSQTLMKSMEKIPVGVDAYEFDEVSALLQWLQENHFTFMAYARTRVERNKKGAERFVTVPGSGLGLLRDSRPNRDPDGYIAPAAEVGKYSKSLRVLVMTKGNVRSHLHHPNYLDVVSVKEFDPQGRLKGTHRFIGLFSAEAYASSPRLIPVLRRKVQHVMERSRLRERSHAHKALLLVLETLPRDELIQSGEDELYQAAMGILSLRENETLRLFMRRDRYGRFFACMLYMARDRYSRDLRERVGALLMKLLQGQEIEIETQFLSGAFARIYCIVRTKPGTEISLSTDAIEQKLLAAARTWPERLRTELARSLDAATTNAIMLRFGSAFDAGYTDAVPPAEAASDVRYLHGLTEAQPLVPRLIAGEDREHPDRMRLKLYVQGEPVVLSDILPMLENFGLRVLGQQLDPVEPKDGSPLWVQEFEVRLPQDGQEAPEQLREKFESAFLRVNRGQVENDGLNRLILCAGLNWRETVLMRAVCRYLLQVGMPFSQSYMEDQLAGHPELSQQLVQLFMLRNDPTVKLARRKTGEAKLGEDIEEALDAVASLDADRVLRAFLGVIRAILRTNFFQKGADGQPKSYVSLKLDPKQIPELPKPRPMFETFVYAPEVEGIHLRGGKVARGGLRWSDRREDFRTEVLGLMKAQMVKNTIIVPVGAKGGFVVKKGPSPTDREAWIANGIECYKTFIRGLLDITDNLKEGECVPPSNVVRRDADDPYLVVAADKGTATFSDIANGLAVEYGFWLGDAFASGGSAGYDHKKMGITARGAWESVKRHFRELGKDTQSEEFTVVGIGDMSGDVFGNGMLLSRHIRLLAAFDHRHILIDPDPDAARSYKERERLFKLPRSSWEDYNKKLISKGGGIWPRKAKSIKLSDPARRALGIEAKSLTPNALIYETLKAPVELLWNGGIGTYVKSSHESHLDAGDRGNDAIRVNGRELRCKVVGEGGNLGLTQLGRIEFAEHGGRLNTDAIDNAGGVHSSDREVNIKIPLNELMMRGKLREKNRNELLVAMTEDVSATVLTDNYVQSQAISLLERDATQRLDEHANLMRSLERDGVLNRAIEFLPDEEALADRRSSGSGLSRPEISVLLSYSKMVLYDALLAGELPDDPWLEGELLDYFPPRLVKRFPDALRTHRLRREIIATILTNAVVNRMGMAFCQRTAEELGLARELVVRAFVVASEVFDAHALWQAIEALDNKLPADTQYRAHMRVNGLVKHAILWALMQARGVPTIENMITRYQSACRELEAALPDLLPPSYRQEWDAAKDNDRKAGLPESLASRLANTRVLGSLPDIVELSLEMKKPLKAVSELYFEVGEQFSFPWLLGAIVALRAEGRWQALARSTLRDDAYRAQRKLAARILKQSKGSRAGLKQWLASHATAVRFTQARVAEIRAMGKADFQALTVILRDIRKLASV